MQNQENSRVFYGGFFVRLAAAWVDALLVSLALISFRMPALFMGDTTNPLYQPILFRFTPWDILLYLLTTAYYVFFTYAAGATLGKRMFSLRVVAADGGKLSLWDVIYRETIGKYLSGAFLFMGYIMAGADREKRAFHDMLADTRVIYSFGKEPRRAAAGYSGAENVAGEPGKNGVTPPQAANAYRNVEDYYRRSEEIYPAADYGYKKAEEAPNPAEKPSEEQVPKPQTEDLQVVDQQDNLSGEKNRTEED